MDIRIAVTRIGIFVLVYSLILGVPFGLTFWGKEWLVKVIGEYWYWTPLMLTSILATAGPFVYLYFQRKAEDRILQEEKRIQSLLTQASYGMTTIHDLSTLFKLITEILNETLKVGRVVIYLWDQAMDQYILKNKELNQGIGPIDGDSRLIKELKKRNAPLLFEEIKVQSEVEAGNPDSAAILAQMNQISASVIVPIVIDQRLLGFIALGERQAKEVYSKDLVNALSVLGNQAALAIENCHFWEKETKRMEEESFLERLQSLDMMAASFAHEIDNPMTIILGQVDLAEEVMNMDAQTMPDHTRTMVQDCYKQIRDASLRVSGMIRAIEEYSKKGKGGPLKPVKFSDVISAFLQLISPQMRKEGINFLKETQDNLPFVLGDKIQLEEILMNFAMNAIHAVRDRKEKVIKLKVLIKNDDWVRVEFSDNGYGIPQKLIKDIFLASVTTKGSSEGTGLGLYRVRNIVNLHKGDVWAESEGPDKGSRFVVELPIYKGDIHDTMDETRGKKLRDV